MVSRGALGPGAFMQSVGDRGITNHQGGSMRRFEEVMGFIMIGLLPFTLLGVVYLTEVLGR